MKQLFTLLLLFGALFNVFAGQGGPDTWGYTWKDSNESGGPVYNWIDIVSEGGTEVKLLGDDNSRGPFPMNFDFPFYWYDVNTFWVGSNGYILFMNGQLASAFDFLPVTTLPNDIIGPFMNDLTFAGLNDSAECYYKINAAKDTLIVSWINVPYWDLNANGQSGNNTFQLILSAVDSSITFQYKEVTPGNPFNGANSSVGIENNSGIIGLFYNGSTYTSPPEQFAIKYYYPTNPSLEVLDASLTYLDNAETGAIFLTNNSSSAHDLIAQVKNTGSIASDPYNVLGVVKDPTGAQVVSDFFLTDTLNPGEKQTFNFTQQLNPSITGTYNFYTTTQLPGDNPPQNNSKTQEIVVVDPTLPEVRLSYDNGQTYLLTYVSWAGGDGGIGTYMIPPFYPATITKLHYFVLSNPSTVGFSARVFDDDGISSLPYTMLDSFFVPSPSVMVNNWTNIELIEPITITSGGFYLSWNMGGPDIGLGMITTLLTPSEVPSNRSFEVFDNIWGIYRDRETQEPLINATITLGFPTGINTAMENELHIQLSPNPAIDHAIINYTVPASNGKVWLMITDLQGKMINRWNLGAASGTEQSFSIDTHQYAAGMYLVELYSGKNKKMDKLVIAE